MIGKIIDPLIGKIIDPSIVKETIAAYDNFFKEEIEIIKKAVLSHEWEIYNIINPHEYKVKCTKCGAKSYFTFPTNKYTHKDLIRVLSTFEVSFTCEDNIIKGIIE